MPPLSAIQFEQRYVFHPGLKDPFFHPIAGEGKLYNFRRRVKIGVRILQSARKVCVFLADNHGPEASPVQPEPEVPRAEPAATKLVAPEAETPAEDVPAPVSARDEPSAPTAEAPQPEAEPEVPADAEAAQDTAVVQAADTTAASSDDEPVAAASPEESVDDAEPDHVLQPTPPPTQDAASTPPRRAGAVEDELRILRARDLPQLPPEAFEVPR